MGDHFILMLGIGLTAVAVRWYALNPRPDFWTHMLQMGVFYLGLFIAIGVYNG